MSIENLTEEQLLEELIKRYKLREEGKCDYCGNLITEEPCRFPERHTSTLNSYFAVKQRLALTKMIASSLNKKLVNRRIRKRAE